MIKKEIISQLLDRGTCDVIVRENLEKKLQSGKKLRVKLGIDPTGTELHLGHAVVLRKLRQFQDAGHMVIFLFGGFTATIGDPTGKNETRPPLTIEQVEKNSRDYLSQVFRILDIEKTEIRNNREWLQKMSTVDILKLMAKKSSQQILARRDFRERMNQDIDIHMHELLYPMLQGYDSVALKADIEIGGSDQLFNLLVGRDLQKKYDEKIIQDVLTVSLIEGTDGVEKMSKSLGNYIGLSETPEIMFGKIMSIPDELMIKYFECLTDIDLKIAKKMISESPRNAKVFLAKDIISWLYTKEDADDAEEKFAKKFVKKEIPDEMPEITVSESQMGILDLITKFAKFSSSNSDARRTLLSGGVKWDNEKIDDFKFTVNISGSHILQVGKKKFARILKD